MTTTSATTDKKDERKDASARAHDHAPANGTASQESAGKPVPSAAVGKASTVDADEAALDRLDAVGKMIRILRPFPRDDRSAIVASLAEMLQ